MKKKEIAITRRDLAAKKNPSIRDALRHKFYESVAQILRSARSKAYRAVNFTMVEAYWNVGRLIVEEEQEGRKRADYGQALLKNLSDKLTKEFGNGFTERNLRNFRQFYLWFPIRHALRAESPDIQKTESLSDKLELNSVRTAYRIDLDPLSVADSCRKSKGPGMVHE